MGRTASWIVAGAILFWPALVSAKKVNLRPLMKIRLIGGPGEECRVGVEVPERVLDKLGHDFKVHTSDDIDDFGHFCTDARGYVWTGGLCNVTVPADCKHAPKRYWVDLPD